MTDKTENESANEKLGLPRQGMKIITIAFDVDGTLRSNLDNTRVVANEDIRTLMRILQKFKNTRIVLWSGSGAAVARQVANELGISYWVNRFASKTDWEKIKPDIAIDDIQDTAIGKINLIVREK